MEVEFYDLRFHISFKYSTNSDNFPKLVVAISNTILFRNCGSFLIAFKYFDIPIIERQCLCLLPLCMHGLITVKQSGMTEVSVCDL